MHILTRNSTNKEIEDFFSELFERKNTSEEFPVNFDKVWQLSYYDRTDALAILIDDFIEDKDYNLHQHHGQLIHAKDIDNRFHTDAFLTLFCFEHFIVRKNERACEIFKKIFHCDKQEKINISCEISKIKKDIAGLKSEMAVCLAKVNFLQAVWTADNNNNNNL